GGPWCNRLLQGRASLSGERSVPRYGRDAHEPYVHGVLHQGRRVPHRLPFVLTARPVLVAHAFPRPRVFPLGTTRSPEGGGAILLLRARGKLSIFVPTREMQSPQLSLTQPGDVHGDEESREEGGEEDRKAAGTEDGQEGCEEDRQEDCEARSSEEDHASQCGEEDDGPSWCSEEDGPPWRSQEDRA